MKVFYIKTTETCNLDCSHCFTSGKSGRKIYFDPVKTAMWVNQFQGEQCHFDYHGGEPFLAPLNDLYKFYELVHPILGDTSTFGATTNLTYKLDDDKLEFMDTVLNKRIGTSWDEGIRWSDDRQYNLWKSNVRLLIDRGYTIKVFISMNTALIERDPKDILLMIKDLGIQELALERLTHDGSATRNPLIFPTNKEIDDWIYDLHIVSEELNSREWLYNTLLESIYSKFELGDQRAGTFCRGCEKMMFTINADGTIAGCPNSAPTSHYATIDDSLEYVLSHSGRSCMIAEENYINPDCIPCEVFGQCGGDCYKLEWDTQCPAPKKLMYGLNNKTNRSL